MKAILYKSAFPIGRKKTTEGKVIEKFRKKYPMKKWRDIVGNDIEFEVHFSNVTFHFLLSSIKIKEFRGKLPVLKGFDGQKKNIFSLAIERQKKNEIFND